MGESVVKVGGVGALMGTKPNLPRPVCGAPGLRGAFIGDGLRGTAGEGFEGIRRAEEEFSTGCRGCRGSGEGSKRGRGLGNPLSRDVPGAGCASSAGRVELIVEASRPDLMW